MKRILAFTLLLFLLTPSLRAEDNDPAAAPQRSRPKVGLVLSGGGAKGMAHIGALKVLEELDIPIDYVVGTSIGSIIGGMYALGYSADELDSLVRAQDWNLLMKDQVPRSHVSFSFKEDNDRYILSIPFWNRKNLREETSADPQAEEQPGIREVLRNVPGALVQGQNLDQLFTKMAVGYQDDIDFNTLPIPFACVAVDLNTKEEVVFRQGDIVTAIRASMSIPGYFSPVRIDEKYLIDGGMINNMPADVAKQMGADYVITVDLHHFKKAKPDVEQTVTEMFASLLGIMNGEKYQSGRAASDIIIEPNTSAYGVLDFDDRSVDALVDSGRVAAQRVFPQLRSLAAHLKEYPDPGKKRPDKAIDLNRNSILVSQMEVDGTDPKEMSWLLNKIHIGPGKTVSGPDMDEAMRFIYSTKCFTKATYDVAGTDEEGYRLKVHLSPQRVHEAELGFRFDSEEMASILLGLSLNKRKLFGSKLAFEAKLGTNMFVWTEYGYTFRNLTQLRLSAGWQHFAQDCYDLIGLEDAQYKLAWTDRYNIFNSEAAYHVTGWRNADISAGVHYDDYRNVTIPASGAIGGSLNEFEEIVSEGATLSSFLRWRYDGLDDSYFPKSGFKVDLEGQVFSPVYEKHPSKYLFYGATVNFKVAIPFGERVTLVPQAWNRWMFGQVLSYHKNYFGGTMAGRYIETQVPFVGINNVHQAYDRMNVARADLCINLFKQHYLTLTGNYLFEWQPGMTHNSDFGAGVAYAINTIVGPVQLVAHWSTISKRPGFHFSLGFDF